MATLPEHREQVRQSHATLICKVVQACQNPEDCAELEPVLNVASTNGWSGLVDTIRQIVAGNRSLTLLQGLDEEDGIIVCSILEGLHNPDSLPMPTHIADASLAAPGLAGMIRAASRGETDALQAAIHMAEQMTQGGGRMAQLGSIMHKLIGGERDPALLCQGMEYDAELLVINILNELGKLSEH